VSLPLSVRACIDDLKERRENIDQVIALLEALYFGESVAERFPVSAPKARADREQPQKRVTAPKPERPKTEAQQLLDEREAKDAELRKACVKALTEHGPLGTTALAVRAGHALGADVSRVMHRMVKEGRARSTGATSGQKWHLGSAPVAKQDPERPQILRSKDHPEYDVVWSGKKNDASLVGDIQRRATE
jgi:hypothetical protein